MPDIVVYLTEDDQDRFVQFLLEAGAWLVADMNYTDPQAGRIDSLDSYRNCRLASVNKFYIQRQDFTHSPLVFRHVEKSGARIYYIGQREGGPNIDFSGGGTYQKAGHAYIRPGGYGYYPMLGSSARQKSVGAPGAERVLFPSEEISPARRSAPRQYANQSLGA